MLPILDPPPSAGMNRSISRGNDGDLIFVAVGVGLNKYPAQSEEQRAGQFLTQKKT